MLGPGLTTSRAPQMIEKTVMESPSCSLAELKQSSSSALRKGYSATQRQPSVPLVQRLPCVSNEPGTTFWSEYISLLAHDPCYPAANVPPLETAVATPHGNLTLPGAAMLGLLRNSFGIRLLTPQTMKPSTDHGTLHRARILLRQSGEAIQHVFLFIPSI
jgi:hypothetical protein